MRVFVTGGTGHSGSSIIGELIAAGHEVTSLARSDTAAAALSALGAKVRRGTRGNREAAGRGREHRLARVGGPGPAGHRGGPGPSRRR
jgi:uncharacterized protein YbjT (DUF2867 family)